MGVRSQVNFYLFLIRLGSAMLTTGRRRLRRDLRQDNGSTSLTTGRICNYISNYTSNYGLTGFFTMKTLKEMKKRF